MADRLGRTEPRCFFSGLLLRCFLSAGLWRTRGARKPKLDGGGTEYKALQ